MRFTQHCILTPMTRNFILYIYIYTLWKVEVASRATKFVHQTAARCCGAQTLHYCIGLDHTRLVKWVCNKACCNCSMGRVRCHHKRGSFGCFTNLQLTTSKLPITQLFSSGFPLLPIFVTKGYMFAFQKAEII